MSKKNDIDNYSSIFMLDARVLHYAHIQKTRCKVHANNLVDKTESI